jgi:hypothetical protein
MTDDDTPDTDARHDGTTGRHGDPVERPTKRRALRSLSEHTVTRRRLLAGGATAASVALAGCTAPASVNRLNPFWDAPIEMKVVHAAEDQTDVRCELPDSAVEDHPVMQGAMEELADAEVGERVTRKLSTEEGQAISNTFTEQCETVGGLYEYQGNWYLVGLTFEAQSDHQEYHDGTDHDHSGGSGNTTATETSSA